MRRTEPVRRAVVPAILVGLAATGLSVTYVHWQSRWRSLAPCTQLSQPLEGQTTCYQPQDQASIAMRYAKPLLDPSAIVTHHTGIGLSAVYTFQLPRTMPGPSLPSDPITEVTYQFGAWQGANCGNQTIVRSLFGYRWFPTITVPPYVRVDELATAIPFTESTNPVSAEDGLHCSVWTTHVYAPRHHMAISVSSNVSQGLAERIAHDLLRSDR